MEHVSTKVVCVRAYRSQPSIDPERMQQWVPGVKWGAPALGCSFEESLKRRDELLPVIARWSPDHLLTKSTSPIYFENNWGQTQPDTVTVMDYKVHSPAWALGFSEAGTTGRGHLPCQISRSPDGGVQGHLGVPRPPVEGGCSGHPVATTSALAGTGEHPPANPATYAITRSNAPVARSRRAR